MPRTTTTLQHLFGLKNNIEHKHFDIILYFLDSITQTHTYIKIIRFLIYSFDLVNVGSFESSNWGISGFSVDAEFL
ncbi:hypothetical protein L1887_05761 [Cichorium endivia]|nr:hypothetical protein L1887_05761 [Cichorium endivia]